MLTKSDFLWLWLACGILGGLGLLWAIVMALIILSGGYFTVGEPRTWLAVIEVVMGIGALALAFYVIVRFAGEYRRAHR